ncbi:MAG: sugar phosphate isomerase/epimerase family protein, partial [Eubacteriales bacterium]
MKLGIINGWSEESFAYVAQKGLHAVEFCCNYNYDSMEVAGHTDEILEREKKYDVAVGAIGRWGQRRIDADGHVIESALQHDKNLIDASSVLGCPVFNAGCNAVEGKSFEENCKIAIDYFSRLLDYAKGKNVKIAVYNCDWENFVFNDSAWEIVLGALPELGL